ncbi:MAG: hypothetical protein JSU06_15035 [Actinobacteria bacterium]|nr:hypothetical protein [Actinomycetota bacterium]
MRGIDVWPRPRRAREAAPHERARAWAEETLSGAEAVGFAWPVLLGFARVSTNPRIYERPLAIEHGAELCSRDNDFARFSGVRWVDPLA